jgi:phage tail sheath protein FI
MTVADDTKTDANESLQIMPASFGYLKCLASAIKTSPNWLAMAGVARGLVPNLQELNTKQLMSNIIAEDYQPKFGGNVGNAISINAITTIKPYGLTIWGNRTLERVDPKGTTALNFLNTRNMISDIKKLSHQTAKSLMFEQDSDELWLDFKSKVSPLLEQLRTGYGISDYQIVKATTKYNGEPLTKGELAAVIRIFPLYAVEYFDITVVISDDES